MRAGSLPLVDSLRAGGQALVGNLNNVALYPDNLLYLVADPLWAFNAHLWLHFLLAAPACFLLGRQLGLSRTGSWAAGIFYASSGFFLSQTSFYNLIAGAALAPAFAAACIAVVGRRHYLAPLVAAVLWTLLVLAGEPVVALLTLVLGASAAWLCVRGSSRSWLLLGACVGIGTVLALPQIVELLRILPGSFRGSLGYTASSRLVASWDPRSIVEWIVPLFFGPPGTRFWGQLLIGGHDPLYLTLYPGLLALALVLASKRSAASRWAWLMVGLGLFVSLGGWNPLMYLLYRLPLASSMRYPIKAWILLALGASLLAGASLDACREEGQRRRVLLRLALLAALLAALWLFLTGGGAVAGGLARRLVPTFFPDSFVAAEMMRWRRLLLFSLALLGGYALALGWGSRRGRWSTMAASVLAVHVGSQLFLLAPTVATDSIRFYRGRPALLDLVAPGEVLVHGCHIGVGCRMRSPDPRRNARRAWQELFSFSAAANGVPTAFATSPDGLDSMMVHAAKGAFAQLSPADLVRALAAAGADVLVVDEPLGSEALAHARLRGSRQVVDGEAFVYALPGAGSGARLVANVRQGDEREVLRALLRPDFDPLRDVYLPGRPQGASSGEPGRAEALEAGLESWSWRTESSGDAVLVTQRAYLSLYRASVDGRPVPTLLANLGQLAVAVPAGSHTVRVSVDRAPFRWALLGVLAGLVGLVGLWRWGREAAVDGSGSRAP